MERMAEKYPSLVKRMWKEGYDVDNHTYSINI
ncbi:MAG: polysaccharide deacetylase family protein [bacterium]